MVVGYVHKSGSFSIEQNKIFVFVQRLLNTNAYDYAYYEFSKNLKCNVIYYYILIRRKYVGTEKITKSRRLTINVARDVQKSLNINSSSFQLPFVRVRQLEAATHIVHGT